LAANKTQCNKFAENEARCNKPITPGVTIETKVNDDDEYAVCTAGPLTLPLGNHFKTYLLTASHCIDEAEKKTDMVNRGLRRIGQAKRRKSERRRNSRTMPKATSVPLKSSILVNGRIDGVYEPHKKTFEILKLDLELLTTSNEVRGPLCGE
jgi:hypothetical protein